MDLAWTHNPLWVIINSLVAFRLTRLLIDDQLPPIPHLRDRVHRFNDRWLAAQFDNATSQEAAIKRIGLLGGHHPVLSLITCYWCAGFWISAAVTAAASLLPAVVWMPIALPFALSAVVGLLARLSD